MTRIRMIHEAITPGLANYAGDGGNLVSEGEFKETNINPTTCSSIERTPTPEREVWSETVQFPNDEDATPIPITPYRSKIGNTTEVATAASYSSPAIAVTPIPKEKIIAERPQTPEDGNAALATNSLETRGSSDCVLSADIPVSSLNLAGPITVRDLPNATPRPTPSPEPESMSCLGVPIDLAGREALPGAVTTGYTDSKGFTASLEELDLGIDFLPYNVDAEPLPEGPFADRDYQDAVKAGKHLAKNVADHLGTCTTAPQVSTQLYEIQKRAKELQRFDSPATRTIGLIGDSAAGEFQPSCDASI